MSPERISQNLGVVISRRRKELDLSQEALAELCNLHRTYICDLERGGRNISLRTFILLARGLDIQPPELLKLAMEQRTAEPQY